MTMEDLEWAMDQLYQCEHPTSLIYFDKYLGFAKSWEICDDCHEIFNEQIHKSPEDIEEETRRAEWLRHYHYNGTMETQ